MPWAVLVCFDDEIMAAAWLASMRAWHHRARCSELSHRINAALQDHDLVGAVEGLQQQLRLDCSHDVERLLFVRQSRPASQRMSLNLFMAMDHCLICVIIIGSMC